MLLALPALSPANMTSAGYVLKGGTISSGGKSMSSASYAKSGIVIGSPVFIPGPPGPPASANYMIKPLVYTPQTSSGATDSLPPVTTAAPPGGSYITNQSVTLTCNDASGTGCANTYYTTDGSTPSVSSSTYSGSISITSNTVLKYFSRDANGNTETVKKQTYLVTPTLDYSSKAGTTFTLYRVDPTTEVATKIYEGSTTSYTDTDPALDHNTIYSYYVTSDTQPAQTNLITIRTPLYNGWNIVGVPYNTNGVTPATLFGSPVSAAYEWVPTGSTNPDASGSYVTVSSLTPGKGYFVKAGNSSTMLFYSGTANPASVNVTIKPGYTLISNTQTSNMTNIGTNWLITGYADLNAAVTANKIDGTLYWWNGTTYDPLLISNPATVIEPWKAYWILNKDNIDHTLTIK